MPPFTATSSTIPSMQPKFPRSFFSPTAPLEVTLRALGHCDEFDERVILLSPGSKIHIGRSSRSSKVSPLPATNNAYFDCPVMSREHAVLLSSTARGHHSVSIKDCGSMHGTRVNNIPVEKDQAVTLKNGDILQIGADIYRETDAFLAPKFRFGARSVLPNSSSRPVSSSVFAVPDAETSEEEEENSDDEPTLTKVDQTARYGSQSNPVNVDDFEDSQSHAGAPAAEAPVSLTVTNNKVAGGQVNSESVPKSRPERQYSPLSDDGFFDLNHDDDYLSDNASHGSAASPTYSNASRIYSEEEYESHDEDGEEEDLFPEEPLPRLVLHSTKSETIAPAEPVKPAYSSDVSDYEFSDDGLGHSSDRGSSPASSPVAVDTIQRSKLTEMLNHDREKELAKATVSTNTPGLTCQNQSVSQMPNMAEAQAQQIQSSVTVRACGTPMSLKNIMVNEKDVAPPSSDAATVATTQFTENTRRVSNSPELGVFKVLPKGIKPLDATHGPMDFYVRPPWITGPAPPRHTTQKTSWIAGLSEYESNLLMRENDPWAHGGRSNPLAAYQDQDYRQQEGWYAPYGQTMGDATIDPVGRQGNYPDYVTNLPNNPPVNAAFAANVSPPYNVADHATVQPKSGSGDRTGGPAAMMPTPPAASPASRSTDQPLQEQHEPTKARTKVSIPEILELVPRPSVASTTVGSLKRKADVLDVEQPSEVTSSLSIKSEHDAMPSEAVAPEQPPKKRLRLQFAATAVAGAVVGGLGVLGALISLPDSWLQ